MADRQLRIDLDVVTQKAQQHLKEAEQASGKLGDELGDTRTKGEKVADAMRLMAQVTKQELLDARGAADALAQALGPEMVAKLEQGGAGLDGLVDDLRKTGLTFQDIRDDADKLAQAVKDVDQARGSIDNVRASAEQLDGQLGHVRDTGDQSRSVLANMVGNSAQDLGALGGVAGSSGVMLGQLAEYAADGNIELSGLAKTAGPMLVLSGVIAGVAAIMESGKKRAEELRKQFEAMKKVQEDLADAKFGDAAEGLYDTYGDLIGQLSDLGLSIDDIVGGFKGENDIIGVLNGMIEEHQIGLGHSGGIYDATGLKLKALKGDVEDAQGAYAKAKDEIIRHDEVTRGLTTALQGGDQAMQDVADRAEYYKSRVAAAKGETEQLGDKVDETSAALEHMDGVYGILTGHLDERSAWRNLGDALAEFQATATDTESSWSDIEAASDDAVTSAANYIETAAGIPPEIKTQLYTMLDEGKLSEVVLMLDNWKKGVDIPLRVIKPGELGYEKRASGGPAGGLTLVGEQGPELVDLPSGSFVHDATSTSRMLAPSGPVASLTGLGSTTVNVRIDGSVYGVDQFRSAINDGVRAALTAAEREARGNR